MNKPMKNKQNKLNSITLNEETSYDNSLGPSNNPFLYRDNQIGKKQYITSRSQIAIETGFEYNITL